jgi:NADPH:quinone reductase-like Zn-dependent oxidoreductase
MNGKRILKWTAFALLLGLVAWLQFAYWTSTNDCERLASAPGEHMKAIVYCEYGSADVLQLREIPKPIPADNEILVRVSAASLNPADETYRGSARMMTGLRKPKVTRFGIDCAGTVEAVGKDVKTFAVGDEVFGAKRGALSEYICMAESRGIAHKPANISFEQAAAIPVAALTALQGLRDHGRLRAGQRVLINGASGGVGTFAVQIAKALDAEVTAVCSTRNVELVRGLGADRVLDYTTEDFTAGGERYDVLLDLVCNHSYSERRRILNENGICVMAGVGGTGSPFGSVLAKAGSSLYAYLRSRFTGRKFVSFIASMNASDLGVIHDFVASGKVTPVVDRTFPFNETPDAVRYLETGHARGKVVVVIAPKP